MKRLSHLCCALVTTTVVGTTALTGAASAQPMGTTALAGGSNYDFYGESGCDREPFGVVNSFDTGRATITAQLAQMYQQGQRRLRIGLFHHHAGDSGTVTDSTGPVSEHYKRNLADLLAAVRQAGFAEVEFSYYPVDANNPGNWSRFDEKLYQENWNFVAQVHPVLAAAGIPYKVDLLNEGMPMTGQQVRLEYAKRLWADYTANFGRADTVGFSMTVWLADRANQLRAVYGDNPPDLLDIHLYGDTHNGDEYTQFVNADKKLRELGYTQDWVIGETWFNDTNAAQGIGRAIAETGRRVRYLAQWPLARTHHCDFVDSAPPIKYDVFRQLQP
ncbi:hypothetical protein [Kutzneria albida]|uniref:Putative secreted protein n=1 Tax=Kutzneria albida DSM 43870 TaxID=1449976 RepID=W5W7K5_9PSEU|nr:hypothetical protein [Kutzneria albida]AHH97118.1 putative secreted protein [Kutzneria albida DSM 43870]